MPHPSADDQLLLRYLLDQVSDEERTRVEEQFLADDDYYRQLLIVEDELRSAYAMGSLSPEERERFETRFLIFDDERQKVDLTKAMLAELSVRRWWDRPWEVAGSWGTPLRVAAAAAVVVLVALSWLAVDGLRLRGQLSQFEAASAAREQAIAQELLEDRDRLEQLNRDLEAERSARARLEQELAGQREPVPPDATTDPAPVISLFLAPGRLRAGGETGTVTVPPDVRGIRLVLDLGERRAYRSYQAEIRNADGTRVWNRAGLPAGDRLLILTVPEGLLPEDDYQLELRGLTAAGELERAGDYYFTTLKP